MPDLTWYFPETLDDVPALLQKDGVVPHAGGTGLTAGRLQRIKGLIDLRRLPLTFFRSEGTEGGGADGFYELGTMLTYRQAADHISQYDESHVLVRALCQAASTPLRNRITLGGSIAFYPLWSDLMGPLIALEAQLSLLGRSEERVSVVEYLQKPELRQNRLIMAIRLKSVDVKTGGFRAVYHRETRTVFDYPAFSLTILLRNRDTEKPEPRIVISGVKGKYRRQEKLEEIACKRSLDAIDEELVEKNIEVEFPSRRLGSPEYLKHLAVTALCRGLHHLSDKGGKGKQEEM